MKLKSSEFLIKNKHIIPIIFSFITYITLCINSVIAVYNPLSWLLLILLFIAYSKINFYNKEFFKSSIIYSFIFSLLLTIGIVTCINMNNPIESIWEMLLSFHYLFTFISLFLVCYSILINILPKLYNYKIFIV